MNSLRVFVSSAVFSFRAQFDWLNPSMWLTMKLVLSFSQMAFFVFVGLFSGGGADVISFIAIGNALQALSWNTVFSVIQITGHDKWDGTLPLVLATPASRLPLFVGRAMIHVLDGLISVAISFFFAAFIFGVNFTSKCLSPGHNRPANGLHYGRIRPVNRRIQLSLQKPNSVRKHIHVHTSHILRSKLPS
jgi:ABC-type multidrug transport system permease subunit